ncbi:TetR family transcriptional regulator [Novosphingobium sp. P6W]|uniref:TetR family transcriptional regulator n=1 Tax=Novosphingobium sp. P6W TaxID=1609758 RepID=UPI0006982601|nr:TetR family transcriptional regulator [Novosphingobium sp. P6W]
MPSSYDRLVATVQGQWEEQGGAAISARRISVAAGVPVSSIYHHFESLEHLLVAAQQAQLVRARAWCKGMLAQAEGLPGCPEAFAGFFAEAIDDWAIRQRDLAFAWRECRLLAGDNTLFDAAGREWDQLWAEFWQEASERFALGQCAGIADRMFENESFLHMLRWRRLVDRAGLDEMARTLGALFCRKPLPPTPWREFAREEAIRSMPTLPQRDPMAAQIVTAAAELIGTSGVASLTHRMVAERAGLTLGMVSHKFKTKSVLMEAAFEGLYSANLERMQAGPGGAAIYGAQDVVSGIVHLLRTGASARGSNELFVAVARDASLRQFGLQLRYLRGRTSRSMLQGLLGPDRPVGIVEAALFSGFTASLIRSFADAGAKLPEDAIRGELESVIALLEG